MLALDLKGKVALITGCDSVESRQIAEAFARAGAVLALHYTDAFDEVQGLHAEILLANGKARLFYADLRYFEEAEALVNSIVQNLGRIDILVNTMKGAPVVSIRDLTLQQWDDTLQNHLYCTFNISKSVSQHMLEQNRGAILQITSEAPYSGLDASVDYSASEGAVHGVTLAMARELTPKGIRVNALAPTAGLYETSREIGQFAVFLTSDLAEGISGEIIRLNGFRCRKEDA